ncbi:MAG: hypothetical protein ABI968_02040 [Acidobacteriota bacterium]
MKTVPRKPRPVQPFGPRLLSYAARLLAFISGEAGCIHSQPALAHAPAWRATSVRR